MVKGSLSWKVRLFLQGLKLRKLFKSEVVQISKFNVKWFPMLINNKLLSYLQIFQNIVKDTVNILEAVNGRRPDLGIYR